MAYTGTDARTPSPLPPPSPPDEPSSSSVVSVLSSSTHTDTMTSANGSVDSFLEQEQASNSSQCESSLQLLLQPETPVLGAGVSVGTGTPSPAAELVESDVGVASGEDQNVLDTIIEALKSKDRLYVLKLGEQMDGLIKERGSRTKIDTTPSTAYQKMLVYRCATYYKLAVKTVLHSQTLSLDITTESKIPSRRISELVPAEENNHPTFKIMRRTDQDRKKSKAPFSQPGSVAGEDGEMSDVDPSETGSMGSRSTTSKKQMTIEEREARYMAARMRIFAAETKSKERNASASSSTLSLVSGNASTSGGGSSGGADDADDNVSSAPAESDWTGSIAGDRRRTVGSQSTTSSSTMRGTAYRSGPSPYDVHAKNGQSSSSPSPAVTYPSIYDQHPVGGPGPTYDPSSQPQFAHPPPGGYGMPYPVYGFPPMPGQQQFMYPYYGYTPSHHPLQTSSDPASPTTSPVDAYAHPPNQHPHPPYMWPQYALPPPHLASGHAPGPTPTTQGVELYAPVAQRGHPVQHPVPGQGHSHSVPPPPPPHQQIPPQHPPQPYPGYGPALPYGPVPGQPYVPYNGPHASYYSMPPPPPPPPGQPHGQLTYPLEHGYPSSSSMSDASTSSSNGGHSPTFSRNGHGHGHGHVGHTHGHGAHFSIGNHPNNGGNGSNNNTSRRGAPPHPPARGSWGYGPGVGMSGTNHAVPSPQGAMTSPPVSVGPRLGMRKTSGGSSSGPGSNTGPGVCQGGNRSVADDVSTISSCSSNSRRTYTQTQGTAAPKHPLPARPDWAAGMKAQPTLAPTQSRRPHNNSNNANTNSDSNNSSRNMSPAKPPMHLGPGHPQFHVHAHLGGVVNPTPSVLQPNDFPPLSMAAETRMPAVGGAWSSGQTKTIVGSQPHGPASVAQSQGGPLSPSPNNGGGGSYGTALFIHGVNGVHGQAGGQYQHPHQPQQHQYPNPRPHPMMNPQSSRLDDDEKGFERPPPKMNAELFNPKSTGGNVGAGVKRTGSNGGQVQGQTKERLRADGAALVEKIAAMELQENGETRIGEGSGSTSTSQNPAADFSSGSGPAAPSLHPQAQNDSSSPSSS